MAKKCIYCKTEIPCESVIDFCESCGVQTWGVKMFKTIKASMEQARVSGSLLPEDGIGTLKFMLILALLILAILAVRGLFATGVF